MKELISLQKLENLDKALFPKKPKLIPLVKRLAKERRKKMENMNLLNATKTIYDEFKIKKLHEFESQFINHHPGDSGIGGNTPQEPIYELNTNEPHELQLFISKTLDEAICEVVSEIEKYFDADRKDVVSINSNLLFDYLIQLKAKYFVQTELSKMKEKCPKCNCTQWSIQDKKYLELYGNCWGCDKEQWEQGKLTLEEFEKREVKSLE
jgi:hypothetical protein